MYLSDNNLDLFSPHDCSAHDLRVHNGGDVPKRYIILVYIRYYYGDDGKLFHFIVVCAAINIIIGVLGALFQLSAVIFDIIFPPEESGQTH